MVVIGNWRYWQIIQINQLKLWFNKVQLVLAVDLPVYQWEGWPDEDSVMKIGPRKAEIRVICWLSVQGAWTNNDSWTLNTLKPKQNGQRFANNIFKSRFLAATKQLYECYFLSVCPSVCLSVCPSHLFDYVPIIVSSWNFQELLPRTRVTSMQKVKIKGQGHRGHNPT